MKRMYVNAREAEESRIAIMEKDRLEELYLERASAETLVGNIYKGIVMAVQPSIQAAFVDIGTGKNGFLHASDVMSDYGKHVSKGRNGKKGTSNRSRRHRMAEDLLQKGQEVLVQVTRDAVGDKGPTLTTYLSIPGRYLVLMPSLSRAAVSRKIEDDGERKAMKRKLKELNPPEGIGFIVRTAGADRSVDDLEGDMNYLLRLWKVIASRTTGEQSPTLLYQESDLVIRTMRDIFSEEIDEVMIDSESVYKKTRDFLRGVMPGAVDRVKLHESDQPIFHRYGLEEKIERIYDPKVELPSGGSIVIEQTEALVAIDVNSGKFTREKDPEETSLRTNMEAAEEIVRQLKLRDMGGLIVVDFIDVRKDSSKRKVEKVLQKGLDDDRARSRMLPMSRFGVIEITRQKVRPGVKRALYRLCEVCNGSGQVKTVESMALMILRKMRVATPDPDVRRVEVSLHPEVLDYLKSRKGGDLQYLEDTFKKEFVLNPDKTLEVGDSRVMFVKKSGKKSDPFEGRY